MKGQAPSAADAFWRKAAERLDVEKSLERVDDHAKHLLGLYAILSALLAGTGIVTGATYDADDIKWIALPLIPMVFSLALAVAAITPAPKALNPADLESVRAYYSQLISSRGRLIFGSSLFFAVSLLLTIPAFLKIHDDKPEPVLLTTKPSVTISKAAQGFDLKMKADMTGLPAATKIAINAAMKDGGEITDLLRHEAVAAADGTATVEVEVPVQEFGGDLVLTITADAKGARVYSQTTTIAAPRIANLQPEGKED